MATQGRTSKVLKWLKSYWSYIVIFAAFSSLFFVVFIYLPFVAVPAHQQRMSTFMESTGLPYKPCAVNSPYLTVIAQNETEFRQAIQTLNATTIYYSGYDVYVFSSDYTVAYRYYVP